MSDYTKTLNSDGSWSLAGEGPMRPLVVEGETLAIARQNWMTAYGRQYEEMEQHSARAVMFMEKNADDLRHLAAEYRNYKGEF